MGITSCDEGEEDSDDGMTDIRQVAAFNSLRGFFEQHDLTVFVGVASRKCQGMSIDVLKAKSESQIRQLFQVGEGINEADVTQLVKVLGELSTTAEPKNAVSSSLAEHSAAVCLA